MRENLNNSFRRGYNLHRNETNNITWYKDSTSISYNNRYNINIIIILITVCAQVDQQYSEVVDHLPCKHVYN